MTAPRTLTIRVPGVPPRQLSPNASREVPWRMRARLKDEMKSDWGYAIRDAVNAALFVPFAGAVSCQLTVYRRRIGKVWDGDNLLASCKWGLDQLQAVGLVADDRDIRYLPIVQCVDPENKGYVEVTLTEVRS